jgi:hypothetical protein
MPVVDREATQQRIHEIQVLLQQWYRLTMASTAKEPQCSLTRCNLVLYHLMYLNTVTNFAQIERLARREGMDEKSSLSQLALSEYHNRCILQHEEALIHSGQVLRLLRQMPRNRRPNWWPAAMYRAILVLWADSVTFLGHNDYKSGQLVETGSGGLGQYQPNLVPIDATNEIDPVLTACIWQSNATPVLTNVNGTAVGLGDPSAILTYGIKSADEADSSRFGDGIRRKLATLQANWQPLMPWLALNNTSVGGDPAESWEQMDLGSQNL